MYATHREGLKSVGRRVSIVRLNLDFIYIMKIILCYRPSFSVRLYVCFCNIRNYENRIIFLVF